MTEVRESSTEAGSEDLLTGRLYLLIMNGSTFTSRCLPSTDETIIGSDPKADIRIDDASVGGRHVVLHLTEPLQIEDLGSASGTQIGPVTLRTGQKLPLRYGEVFTIGSVGLVVQRGSVPLRRRRIWSHVDFEARLAEECARAERHKCQFSVARIRMENPVASTFQRLLGATLRPCDVLGSYGPNEFEIILDGASATDAEKIVQRVVSRLGGPACHTAVSNYPRDGFEPEALLEKASTIFTGGVSMPSRVVVQEDAMKRLYAILKRVAPSDISALILGETGVGKDVLARAIHAHSLRADKPFVGLNCGAISESLLESELFGHERGAFTGAVQSKEGLLESAKGGTVFLDEVGDLPPSVQLKLLRVIEERQVLRVGGLTPRPLDARFIAATNVNLEEGMARGTFREDFYFRLNGITLMVPPLRERVGEIRDLAISFATRASSSGAVPTISADALRCLMEYDWPGNIRELKNVIERAVLLCANGVITPNELPLEKMAARKAALSRPPPATADNADNDRHSSARQMVAPPPSSRQVASPDVARAWQPVNGENDSDEPVDRASPPESRSEREHLLEALDKVERQRLADALTRFAGNQTRTAKALGISRRTLLKRLNLYDFPRPRKDARDKANGDASAASIPGSDDDDDDEVPQSSPQLTPKDPPVVLAPRN